jgi:hypothetical protein
MKKEPTAPSPAPHKKVRSDGIGPRIDPANPEKPTHAPIVPNPASPAPAGNPPDKRLA